MICRPSDQTVGRPRAEIRTRARRPRGRDTTPSYCRPPHLHFWFSFNCHQHERPSSFSFYIDTASVCLCRLFSGWNIYSDFYALFYIYQEANEKCILSFFNSYIESINNYLRSTKNKHWSLQTCIGTHDAAIEHTVRKVLADFAVFYWWHYIAKLYVT